MPLRPELLDNRSLGSLIVVQPKWKLTIEPGAVVLFAPGVGVDNQGTLTATSDGPWIVLACAEPARRWKGIDSSGTVAVRRCLLDRADVAVEVHHRKNGLTATGCVFSDNGFCAGVGNGGSASVEDCLLFRNETGLYGHGDNGKVTFARCLLLFNGRGCAANFYGGVDGVSSTFYGNDTGVEAGDQGDFVRVRMSNVLASRRQALGTRGGQAHAAGNYWGKEGPPPADARGSDVGAPLPGPVKDAIPALPACEYLKVK